MDIWAIIVLIIIAMVAYGYLSSKWSDRKKKKTREATIPIVKNTLNTNQNYRLVLSDGRVFENIKIIGTVEGDNEQFSIGGWEGMLIVKQESGKNIYIKKTAVRYVEEI